MSAKLISFDVLNEIINGAANKHSLFIPSDIIGHIGGFITAPKPAWCVGPDGWYGFDQEIQWNLSERRELRHKVRQDYLAGYGREGLAETYDDLFDNDPHPYVFEMDPDSGLKDLTEEEFDASYHPPEHYNW